MARGHRRTSLMKIHLNRAGQSLGQFSAEEVRAGFQEGKFLAGDLAWQDGMPMWKPLGEVIDEIAPLTVGGAPPEAVAPGLPGAVTGCPWENRAELGFFGALFQMISAVLFEPVKTFRAMPVVGGFGAPLLFYALCVTLAAVAGVIYQVLLEAYVPGAASEDEYISYMFGTYAGVGLLLISLPVMVAMAAFVGATFTHLSLMIVGGAKKSYEATFRVFCYAGGATGIIQLLPVCGALIAGVWNIVAMTIGLSEVHGISRGRALVAVLLPLIFCCAAVAAVFLLAVSVLGLAGLEAAKS